MNCNTCKFWSESRKVGKQLGMCHRYPEHIECREDDWCGEYAAQQSVEPTVESGEAIPGVVDEIEEL